MNQNEIYEFIERMEEIGDIWEYDDVKRVYGDKSLEYAINERMTTLNTFAGIIHTVLNRDHNEE